MEDYHPELANYEPYERPIRSKRTVAFMRVAVLLAITALVLPGIVTTMSFASATADQACAVWVQYQIPQQHRSEVRFEFMGAGGIGWECYAITATGEKHMISLGLLPGLNAEQAKEVGLPS